MNINNDSDEQVNKLVIAVTGEIDGGVWDIKHARDVARFILAREKKLVEHL